jgi:hypothetical protein
MCQAYNCLPTDLWHLDPATPRGYYLNRAVFYFGRKVDSDMNLAENNSRRNRKPGPGTDRLANAARLGVLGKAIGIEIKRHRDPGGATINNPFPKDSGDKDETVVISRGF